MVGIVTQSQDNKNPVAHLKLKINGLYYDGGYFGSCSPEEKGFFLMFPPAALHLKNIDQRKTKVFDMTKVTDENYFQAFGWMINRLHLKGNELIVYAIIHGFTQAEKQWFTGSRKYLADFASCSVGTVDNCLKNLVDKGLLEKQEYESNGVKFCHYRIICTPTTNFMPPPPQNLCHPTTNFMPHNKNIIQDINNIPPISPHGGNAADAADTDLFSELKQRVNSLFHRRETTNWTKKETAKLKEIAKRNDVLEEYKDIERLYNSGYEYRRRDIITFLNNWAVELDRARNQGGIVGTNSQRIGNPVWGENERGRQPQPFDEDYEVR